MNEGGFSGSNCPQGRANSLIITTAEETARKSGHSNIETFNMSMWRLCLFEVSVLV